MTEPRVATDDALAETIWGVWGSDKSLRHQFMWRWIGWNLARQIRAMRKSHGWSQQQLARESGLSFQTINRYEKSCCHASIKNLLRLAHVFDVALQVRLGAFSELIVLMGTGAVVVPRTFDEELAEQAVGRPSAPETRHD